jgi:zinc transporter 1
MARSPSGRKRTDSIDSISLFGHPIQNRAKVIATAQDIATSYGRATSPPPSPTLLRSHSVVSDTSVAEDEYEGTITPHPPAHRASSGAQSHLHSRGRKPSVQVDIESRRKGGHHHGSMNMRALLLHVLGDALGNVGVISSGLIIWQTTWSWKYYSDPMISLLITVIIFSSALPLVKSASYILLQGVLVSTPSFVILTELHAF